MKNSENKNWRDAAPEEFEALMNGLKANLSAIDESYGYSIEDLLEYLKKKGVLPAKR